MIWGLIVLFAGLFYVARTHDKHINTLYRQVADLERRLREAESVLARNTHNPVQ